MRYVVADWGTSRFRALLVSQGRVLDRVEADAGIVTVAPGRHKAVFLSQCGAWLEQDRDLSILLVGMVGSREGWREALYVPCPAGPEDVAGALTPVEIDHRSGQIVPGLVYRGENVDVMRGEETLAFGAGVDDGIVCLAGTHPKWVLMEGGRVRRFATFLTGELYALLRSHSMVGRPASDPPDPAGFALGLDAASDSRAGLLNALFEARANTVTGRLQPAALGPYLSGLLTAAEIEGALALYPQMTDVTLVSTPERAALYREGLARRGVATKMVEPEGALLAGLSRILAAQPGARSS